MKEFQDEYYKMGSDFEMCWLAFIAYYSWNRIWESGEWVEESFDK